MMKRNFNLLLRTFFAASALGLASVSWAGACRVTDFTDVPLSSLNEIQRLSFVSQMTQTEFNRLSQVGEENENYYQLIAESETVSEASSKAWSTLESMGILNFDEFRKFWASDFLTAKALEDFTNCISGREPGLTYAGRPEGPGEFRLTFAHVTPIGIEQITTRLVASHNIANIDEFEKFLENIGPQDNYTATSFVLKKIDPTRRAVLLVRAGWETPDLMYIPIYPTPEYHNQLKKEALPATQGAGH